MADSPEKNAGCEFLKVCDFFSEIMASVPQFSSKIQFKYCFGDFRVCARYAYAKAHGNATIPEDLFPNASHF